MKKTTLLLVITLIAASTISFTSCQQPSTKANVDDNVITSLLSIITSEFNSIEKERVEAYKESLRQRETYEANLKSSFIYQNEYSVIIGYEENMPSVHVTSYHEKASPKVQATIDEFKAFTSSINKNGPILMKSGSVPKSVTHYGRHCFTLRRIDGEGGKRLQIELPN